MSFFKINYDEAIYLDLEDKTKVSTDRMFYYIAGIEKVRTLNFNDLLNPRNTKELSPEEKFNKNDLYLELIISKEELSYDEYLDNEKKYESTKILKYPEIYEDYINEECDFDDLSEEELLDQLEQDPDFIKFFVDEVRNDKIKIQKSSKKWEG